MEATRKASTSRRAAKGLAALVLGVLTLASSGCASVIGTVIKPEPYIGTRFDVSELGKNPGLGGGALLVTDLPFSFVMDTILLPVTIPSLAKIPNH
jgi:uncharacterized protein YceK